MPIGGLGLPSPGGAPTASGARATGGGARSGEITYQRDRAGATIGIALAVALLALYLLTRPRKG